jgi:hypothetical protein
MKRRRRTVGRCIDHVAVLNVIRMHTARIIMWQKLDVSSQSPVAEAMIALFYLSTSRTGFNLRVRLLVA